MAAAANVVHVFQKAVRSRDMWDTKVRIVVATWRVVLVSMQYLHGGPIFHQWLCLFFIVVVLRPNLTRTPGHKHHDLLSHSVTLS